MSKEIGEMISKWQKLDRICCVCGLGHANIEFTFAIRQSLRIEAYHYACTPEDLSNWQKSQEAAMLEYAQTSPSIS